MNLISLETRVHVEHFSADSMTFISCLITVVFKKIHAKILDLLAQKNRI